jgi:glycosyltransferase involved in cell wall biosynthesis
VLVDVRDPAAMAAAALRLLREPAWRSHLGETARRSMLARFSRSAVAAATESIYRELAARPATRMVGG